MKRAQVQQVDEMSIQKLRENHETYQQLTSQLQQLQEQMNSMSSSTPPPTSKLPEDREFVIDSGASVHMLSKKDLSSDEIEALRRSRTPYRGGDKRRKFKQTRKHKYTFTILVCS